MNISPARESLLHWLNQYQSKDMQLYYLLDAAADEQFPERLESLNEGQAVTSLFCGTAKEALKDVAPYLIMLDTQSSLFELLIDEGADKDWGIYILSEQPFYELVQHCQNHLSAKLFSGETAYFRFYDPRILTVFCQSSEPDAICELKGENNLLFVLSTSPALQMSIYSDGQYDAINYA